MLAAEPIILTVKSLRDDYISKYDEAPNVLYLGRGQLESLEDEHLYNRFATEATKMYGLDILEARAGDFVGVAGDQNKMNLITVETVKEKAEKMLRKHLNEIEYPETILLGYQQYDTASMSDKFEYGRKNIFFYGIKVKLVPVINYIGVI